VIPEQGREQDYIPRLLWFAILKAWIPAFAGMTKKKTPFSRVTPAEAGVHL